MSNGFQQRNLSGALFKNDKGGNEARPDYRGDICINGVNYELAAWIKEGQKGKYMSLSAKEKEEQPAQRQSPPSRGAPPSRGGFDDLDDAPF